METRRRAARLAAIPMILFVALSAPSAQKAGAGAPGRALDALHARIDKQAEVVLPKVVSWRRDIHQHPELGNREVRTANIVAEHLRSLGLDVVTGVAHTGVVGILRGGKPGPVVALRADMDALPVTEEVDVPFKSTARATLNGRGVGVMHACGHDMHTAMLLGTAEVLAGLRAELAGTVKFIFQPAEEGAPEGEDGGAELMVRQGVLENPKVEAIFCLHVFPFELGSIVFRPGGLMAASDTFRITVRGRQTHAALPWDGVDPIVVSAEIILGLQTIVSRQSDLTVGPAVITVGIVEGGIKSNIIPDEVHLTGTIRTFDAAMRSSIQSRIKTTAEHIAAAAGATATVQISEGNPVTYNDPALTERMTPSLKRVAGGRFEPNGRPKTTSEDFAFYQQKIPGLYFLLGIAPKGADPATIAPNHSPRFAPDEGALITGVRALASVAVDYLNGNR
jgi:amidohydrolase